MNIQLNSYFCLAEAPWLQWFDVQYGLEYGFLSPQGAIQCAVISLAENSSAQQYELACLDGEDANEVVRCVNELVADVPQDVEEKKKVWIFLIFLWLFRNRDSCQDPLRVVEELYADFGYPEYISPFVRYMPVVDSCFEGDKHLFRNWSDMLDCLRKEFQTKGMQAKNRILG